MMKCITVTLNPALDMNIALAAPLLPVGLNRSESASFSPGGKGINVSRALHALGSESEAICILGGFTGAKIKSMLSEEGVSVRAIATSADTRINISLIPPDGADNDAQCEINNPPMRGRAQKTEGEETPRTLPRVGAAGIRSAAETAELLSKTKLLLRRLIHRMEGERVVVVFAGSIPPDMPQNTYADLIGTARAMGAVTVCDCDGDALRHALSAHPDYIKPNIDELSALTERRLLKDQVAMAATEISVTTGGDTAVLATVGSGGAYLARGKDSFYAPAVHVDHVRTLKGAGDTFLAAFLYAIYEKNGRDTESLSYAAHIAAQKITGKGLFAPNRSLPQV